MGGITLSGGTRMTHQIDNIIILGRGVPELISDGRVTVCVAGYSREIGFVRLYPTRIDSPLNVWNIVSVEVERNPKDSRLESWKFPDSRTGYEHINDYMDVQGDLPKQCRMELVDELRSGCVSEINEKRMSLGIVKPTILKPYLATNQMNHKSYTPLFAFIEHANISTKKDYPFEPRIEYKCGEDCMSRQSHDQQLLDWGCYRWMEDHPGREEQIWRNLHFGESDYLHYFLVGNQANQRTSYMVINVLRQKTKMVQMSLAL
jgi:hypothetical protein